MNTRDLFRLAHHDAICANGGRRCADRDSHARRNMSDTEATAAATSFLWAYEGAS